MSTKHVLAVVILIAGGSSAGGCAAMFNRDPPLALAASQPQPQGAPVVAVTSAPAGDSAAGEGPPPRVAVPSQPPGPLPSQAPEAVVPPVYPPPPPVITAPTPTPP